MFYSPLSIANEFIRKSDGHGVTHMKLQKLVYLALEEWLKDHDTSFLSENPEVWQYGPVFSDLYHQLKEHRSALITQEQNGVEPDVRIKEKDILSVIDKVWEKYKRTLATVLSDLTHKPDGPWYQTAKKFNFSVPYGTEIPTDVIKKCVREKAETKLLQK